MWLIIIAIIILTLYSIVVSIFYVGWKRIQNYRDEKITETGQELIISVIVACKDEEENIGKLIESLLNQSFPDFELIIVNDHSGDRTVEIVNQSLFGFNDAKILNAVGYGKKNALKEGILYSNGNFIVTTDADCIPGPDWLKTIYDFQSERTSDLIIGPVQLIEKSTIFSKIQALEFVSLIVSGAGAAGAGMPIMCNGANLAFRKETWLKSQHELKANKMSGDDIFLLHSVKKRKETIQFLKSDKAIVKTEGKRNISALMTQRRRWTSKAGSYSDWQTIFVAAIVFSISFFQILLFFLLFFSLKVFIILVLSFVVKFIFDLKLLISAQSFFRIDNILINSFLLSVFYPFYIICITFSSLLFRTRSWR